jgi:uncharacterized membrane protein
MPSDFIAQAIDRYLETLRKHCARVSPAEADEFVGEIRSHIMDRISAQDNPTPETLEALLQRVGDPKQLAARLVAQTEIRRATRSLSPWTILRGILRFAMKGVAGVVSFLITVAAYGCAAVCALVIVLKPVLPHRIGLWLGPARTLTLGYWDGEIVNSQLYGISLRHDPVSFVIGTLGPASGPVRDLAGSHIYVIAALAGAAFFAVATLFGRWVISRLSLRKFRGSLSTATPVNPRYAR